MRDRRDPGGAAHARSGLIPTGLALAFALVSLCLLPVAFVSDDLQFLTGMELGNVNAFEFWLPSRFLWQPTGYALNRLAIALGGPEMALPTIQIFNVLVSAAVLVVSHRVLTTAGCGPRAANVATLGLAFSAYFWSWSMRVKMYPLHLLFLVLVLLFVLVALKGTSGTAAPAAGAGLSLGFALYYHQSALLLLAVTLAVVPLLLAGRRTTFMVPFLGAFALAFSLFYIVYATFYGGGFLRWYTFEWRHDYHMRGHIGGAPTPQRMRDYADDLWCSVVNHQESNVFSRYAVTRPPGGWHMPIEDLRYDEVPRVLRGPLTAGAAGAHGPVSVLVGAVMLGGLAWGLPRLRQARGAFAAYLGACLLGYAAGFLILDWTGYLYYAVWIFAWLLLGLALSTLPDWSGSVAAVAVAALLAHNLLTAVLPQAFVSNHRVARDVVAARGALRESDVVVCAGTSPDAWYWSYFVRCQAVDVTQLVETRPEAEAFAYLVERVDRFVRGGHRVLVDEQALQSGYLSQGRVVADFGHRLQGYLRSHYRVSPSGLPRMLLVEGERR